MQSGACCFAGHKFLPEATIEKLVIRLNREIEKLLSEGVTNFISGGAVGFDQIAAALIVSKKEVGKNIRLIFALPCGNQNMLWNERQNFFYSGLLKKADEIIYISQSYTPFCIEQRNKYMVENSSHCICALRNEKSETGKTVRFALEKKLQVIHVADFFTNF